MGMRGIIQNAVKSGLKGIGDIKVNITYTVTTEGASDGRGGYENPTETDYTIESTIVSYQNRERLESGGLIASGDRKVIIEKRLLDAESITVKKSDKMTLDDGATYKIINPRLDPSNNVYFFQMRQV